jgi:hypothetical protein
MAKNNLDVILQKEGLTSNQLAAGASLNKSTVKSVLAKKRSVAPSTQEFLVRTLNRLTKKSYSLEEIFPVQLAPKERLRARAAHFAEASAAPKAEKPARKPKKAAAAAE